MRSGEGKEWQSRDTCHKNAIIQKFTVTGLEAGIKLRRATHEDFSRQSNRKRDIFRYKYAFLG